MRKLLRACVMAAALGGAVAVAAVTTVAPVAVKQVKPTYPADLLKENVTGSVLLAIEVKTDGTVGKVRVVRGLNPGMDAEAVRAAKQWQFKPGTRNGKPVRVETRLEMSFAVR